MSFKKRVPTAENVEGVIIIEALSVPDNEEPDLTETGLFKDYFEIFDDTKAYVNGTGLQLGKTVDLSGNNLLDYLTVMRCATANLNGITTSDITSIIKNNPTSPTYWSAKATNQTTAMDAAKQYRVNTADKTKLRLTLEGSSTELATGDLSQILLPTEKLIVVYRIVSSQIVWSF